MERKHIFHHFLLIQTLIFVYFWSFRTLCHDTVTYGRTACIANYLATTLPAACGIATQSAEPPYQFNFSLLADVTAGRQPDS